MAQTPALKYKDAEGSISYTAVSAVNAGDVILIGTVPCIAPLAIAAGAVGTVCSNGQWKVPKLTGAISAGDAIYWDVDGTPVYSGATALSGACGGSSAVGNLMGFAAADAASGDTYTFVELTAAKRTATIAGSMTADDITGSDSSLSIAGLGSTTGGAIAIVGGTSSTGAVAGGAVSVTGGTGGAAGAGGAASLVGGIPASGNAAGGTLTASGGAGSGTGAGGAVTTRGGASGAGATGNGGAWSGGGGAALSVAGNGGAATLSGGVSTTTGTGGALTLISGASVGASGTAGAVTLDAGAAAGGTGAPVEIGPTNATGTKIGTAGSERALIKGINVSGTVAVAVPSITDPDCAKVDVDISAMTFAAAVGDAVVAIPLEALPTNCRLGGAWVSATDQVTITFSSEGGNVTGAAKNFKFLIVDLT
jgi:predicted RecA/RadA family phage recombinase